MAKAKKPGAATHAPGDKPRGRGRPPGAKNKRTEQLEEQIARLTLDKADGELMPLDFLLGVLRDENMPFVARMAAADKAAPYCHSKLSSMTVDANVLTGHEAALKELM